MTGGQWLHERPGLFELLVGGVVVGEVRKLQMGLWRPARVAAGSRAIVPIIPNTSTWHEAMVIVTRALS